MNIPMDVKMRIIEADAEITRLRAELAAKSKDAERYAWLRSRDFGFSHDEERRGISTTRWGHWPYDTDEGHSAVCDSAIDSAMGEGNGR